MPRKTKAKHVDPDLTIQAATLVLPDGPSVVADPITGQITMNVSDVHARNAVIMYAASVRNTDADLADALRAFALPRKD